MVTSTGMHTQIGMIAEMLQSYEEEPTPLQQKLDQLGKSLGIVSLAICGVIFCLRRDPGYESGHDLRRRGCVPIWPPTAPRSSNSS